MKNNLLKFYIAALYLCSTFAAFAQPGTDDDTGTLQGDEPAAPIDIDGYVWVLAAIGLVYVFLRIRAFNLQRK